MIAIHIIITPSNNVFTSQVREPPLSRQILFFIFVTVVVPLIGATKPKQLQSSKSNYLLVIIEFLFEQVFGIYSTPPLHS